MRRSFSAAVLASPLRLTFSFTRMWLTCTFTVASFMPRASPISALLLSAQMSRSTWRSVAESGPVIFRRGRRKSG